VVTSYPDVTLVKTSIENYPMFAFNMLPLDDRENPLQDVNLRKAIVTAVDRAGIVNALWGDVTYVPAPFNFPEYGPNYYDPNRKSRYTYNPAQSKEFLAKSSYKGQVLDWHITRGFYPNYEDAAEIMVEQWKAVGINVKLSIVDLLNMSMSSEFTGDPMRPLWVDWGPSSSRVNAAHKTWGATPRFYELGEKFEAESDLAKRKAYYLQLVDEWEDITPGMYLWRNVSNWAHKKSIHWVPTTTNNMYFGPEFMKFGM
jgi:peptide/nickel transport system substrate-binding protein